MKVHALWVSILIGMTTALFAEERPIEETLRNLVLANMKAMETKDFSALNATLDSHSPGYAGTLQQANTYFTQWQLQYELISFKFLAQDGDVAIGRVVQKTTKVSGLLPFGNYVSDSLHTFKNEQGTWKFWRSTLLSLQHLEENQ